MSLKLVYVFLLYMYFLVSLLYCVVVKCNELEVNHVNDNVARKIVLIDAWFCCLIVCNQILETLHGDNARSYKV